MISLAEEILKNTGGDTRASSASSSFSLKSGGVQNDGQKTNGNLSS
jgi:hypothetical protein